MAITQKPHTNQNLSGTTQHDYDAKSNKLLEVFETTLTNYQEVFVHHEIYLYELNFAINVQSIDCIAIHQLNEHI